MIRIDEKGFVLCPLCGRRTKTKVYRDTILKRFPLYCGWCKKEIIIDK